MEYEPLPWYLAKAVVDPATGEILQYNQLMLPKEKKNRYMEKRIIKII